MNNPSKPPGSAPARLEAITARRVRDPYADLLRDSRGMRREVAAAREAWLASLALDRKEDVLFELETLLKSFVAWSNPRNQPPRANTPRSGDRDFSPPPLIPRPVRPPALPPRHSLHGPPQPSLPPPQIQMIKRHSHAKSFPKHPTARRCPPPSRKHELPPPIHLFSCRFVDWLMRCQLLGRQSFR